MTELWVADASPLILLAKANLLHLIPVMASRLVIPEAVVTEISAGPASDTARHLISELIRDGNALVSFLPFRRQSWRFAWEKVKRR